MGHQQETKKEGQGVGGGGLSSLSPRAKCRNEDVTGLGQRWCHTNDVRVDMSEWYNVRMMLSEWCYSFKTMIGQNDHGRMIMSEWNRPERWCQNKKSQSDDVRVKSERLWYVCRNDNNYHFRMMMSEWWCQSDGVRAKSERCVSWCHNDNYHVIMIC